MVTTIRITSTLVLRKDGSLVGWGVASVGRFPPLHASNCAVPLIWLDTSSGVALWHSFFAHPNQCNLTLPWFLAAGVHYNGRGLLPRCWWPCLDNGPETLPPLTYYFQAV